jgi:hypothetical protein
MRLSFEALGGHPHRTRMHLPTAGKSSAVAWVGIPVQPGREFFVLLRADLACVVCATPANSFVCAAPNPYAPAAQFSGSA